LDFILSDREEPLVGATFSRPPQVGSVGGFAQTERVPVPVSPGPIRAAAEHVFTTLAAQLPSLLGPNPSQERFRDIAFYLTNDVL
jgi:hypothetical protein